MMDSHAKEIFSHFAKFNKIYSSSENNKIFE